MEDRQIIRLLFDRAENAIDVMQRKFGKRLYATAMNILGNIQDAEECVNDTYLVLWNTIPPLQPDPLCAYIYRVGRNTALNRLRGSTAQKRDTRSDLSLEELADCIPAGTLEDILDARELGRAIDRFLDTVSRDSRVIFLRRYWFGDSVKDIAHTMGMQQTAVSVRLNRLRNRLKDYLIKEGHLYEAETNRRTQ